jgi:hypothetical protein
MHFVTPLALALAALAAPIVALYFLKLRRAEHTVSSTYLWRTLVRDAAANAPWQRPRANLLLALQLLALALLVLVAVSFAALGFMAATWASTFEQVNFLPTFVVTPLTFLGGVFYSASMLPPGLRQLTLANPVFYVVDGVRFGMLGISDASPWAGGIFLLALAVVTVAAAYRLLESGYRLRG